MEKVSVYVHIPFCVAKCRYCDFLSFPGDLDTYNRYKDALINEIKAYHWHGKQIRTIFIGGGTPTVFPPFFLEEILASLYAVPICEGAEVTIEANPGTVDREKLRRLRAAGVNRLSMGMQAEDDQTLAYLGRVHTREEFLQAYEESRQCGFHNINFDVMFALPGQKLADLQGTMALAASLGPEHISAYSLIVEEGTVFGQWQEAGKLPLPGEEEDREMYRFIREFAGEKGYEQYEISNFARPGYACAHNMVYWERKAYIGFGLGAHSFIEETRYRNEEDLQRYMAGGWRQKWDITPVTREEAMEEFIFLGLRMTRGIDKNDFFHQFHVDFDQVFGKQVRRLQKGGFLAEVGTRLFLTEKGMDVANLVFSEILLKNT